jgi:hypothetical protein
MRIRDEYAHLVVGSKCGAGVQEPSPDEGIRDDWLRKTEAAVDRILLLSHNRWLLQPGKPYAHLGERAIVRVMHDHDVGRWDWTRAFAYIAEATAITIECVGYGVRDFIYLNEWNITQEGGSNTREGYQHVNTLGQVIHDHVRQRVRDATGQEIRIIGPNFSPGNGEDEALFDGRTGFQLCGALLATCDIIGIHLYGGDASGLIAAADAHWRAKRLERYRPGIRADGHTQPFMITEFNHPGTRLDSAASIERYLNHVENYYRWVNGEDDVVAAIHFLATNTDAAFQEYTWARMPVAFTRLARMDRQAELDGAEPGPEPVPTPGGYVKDDRGFEERFSAYVNKTATRRKWAPGNEPSTDEYGVVRQDFTYKTAAGNDKYGTLSTGVGENGYSDDVFHSIFA